jgi:3-hydroxypropanoate dehydrogenase
MSEDKNIAAQQKVRELRSRVTAADAATLDLLFRDARTHYGWQQRAVSDETLRAIYELAKWGPTSMNQQPMRLLFVSSEAAKEKLKPALGPANQPKMMSAPVTAIIAYDMKFYENLPKVFPPNPNASQIFSGNADLAEANAIRNGNLQAAYFMIAARAMGLDIGAMSGFDNAAVDRLFFEGSSWRSNFLCNLGYGDESKIFARLPRLAFDEVARSV